MSDPTIAFLRQPLEILAQGGEAVAAQFIRALGDWVKSDRTDHVVSHVRDRMFVLAAPATPWHFVLLTRGGNRQRHWSVDVCAVEDAARGDLLAHYEPLVELDHLTSMIQVKFKHLDAITLIRAAETLDLTYPRNASVWRPRMRIHRSWPDESPLIEAHELLRLIDDSADRWASSKARSNFKTLLEDARERPQVVERDGDDVVIVSRRYLQETVDPTSAKGLSRRYLGMGLSDEGMPELSHGSVRPLEDLPEIGTA